MNANRCLSLGSHCGWPVTACENSEFDFSLFVAYLKWWKKNKQRSPRYFLLSFKWAPHPPSPWLLLSNVGKASACHTDNGETKREERGAAISCLVKWNGVGRKKFLFLFRVPNYGDCPPRLYPGGISPKDSLFALKGHHHESYFQRFLRTITFILFWCHFLLEKICNNALFVKKFYKLLYFILSYFTNCQRFFKIDWNCWIHY